MFPGIWHEETLASVQAVLRGEEMPAVGYDSDDDPEALVNKRIKARNPYWLVFARDLPWQAPKEGSQD